MVADRKQDGVARRWQRHPWIEWFSRGRFTLVRGLDFACRTDSMAQTVRFAAKQLGVRASVRINDRGDRLTVTVREDER